jgi:hypothetical protein
MESLKKILVNLNEESNNLVGRLIALRLRLVRAKVPRFLVDTWILNIMKYMARAELVAMLTDTLLRYLMIYGEYARVVQNWLTELVEYLVKEVEMLKSVVGYMEKRVEEMPVREEEEKKEQQEDGEFSKPIVTPYRCSTCGCRPTSPTSLS